MDDFSAFVFVFAPLFAVIIGTGAWAMQARANRSIDALIGASSKTGLQPQRDVAPDPLLIVAPHEAAAQTASNGINAARHRSGLSRAHDFGYHAIVQTPEERQVVEQPQLLQTENERVIALP